MRTSDVAFLMPAYNPDPALLAKVLVPLLNQTRSADLIIVDDGSTVPIASLVPDDPRITIVRLEPNAGVIEARNVGLRHVMEAGYTYIACIDADDISREDRIALQVGRLEADPSLDIVGCISPTVDPQGNLLFVRGRPGGPEVMARRVRWNMPFYQTAFCFRSSVVERFGYYSPDFPAAEDYEYLFRIIAGGGGAACLPEPLVTIMIRPDGISLLNRRRQILTRLKTQWRYFDWRAPAAYGGIIASLVTLVLPSSLMIRIKKALGAGY